MKTKCKPLLTKYKNIYNNIVSSVHIKDDVNKYVAHFKRLETYNKAADYLQFYIFNILLNEKQMPVVVVFF